MRSKILSFLVFAIIFTACKNDDNNIINTKTYQLASVSDPAISGTATFTENADGSTTVEINLNGTTAGDSHPAHIHYNTAAESGGIAISLNPVDGDTGSSSTTFSSLDDSEPVSYGELMNFDGYINVHLSDAELGTIVAQGDIGQNELTASTTMYALTILTPDAESGDVTLYERVNGEALLVIELDGTTSGDSHPAHIHMGTIDDPGGIAVTLNPVDGGTGRSATNISVLDGGDTFIYQNVIMYSGYINVHLSAADLGTIVAQTNIGISATQ